MCRGNYRSQWTAQGSYEMVAERYFNQSKVDGFFLEYDDDRSGDFAPRCASCRRTRSSCSASSPRSGASSSRKTTFAAASMRAAESIPIERLCISPQCGFASTQEEHHLSQEQQRAKLSLLVEAATEVWSGVPNETRRRPAR